jgi:hypothetical protein
LYPFLFSIRRFLFTSHGNPPFYMTSRQPHHFTAREHENGSRPMPHAVLLIHLSLSGGKDRGRSVVHEACRRKLVEYHVFRALRPKLNASALISEISSLHLLCSLSRIYICKFINWRPWPTSFQKKS